MNEDRQGSASETGAGAGRERATTGDPPRDSPTAAVLPGDDLDPGLGGTREVNRPSGADRREVTDAVYGRARGYFRRHGERHGDFQRHLRQARVPETYDAYLARWTTRGVLAAVAVAVVAAVGFGVSLWFGAVTGRRPAVVALAALVAGGLAGTGTVGYGYLTPQLEARRRGDEVDRLLPHGVTYLYALSNGGVGIVDAIRNLAQADDTHGELAAEFDAVVREMDYFGRDPMAALRVRRDETPSPELARFLDDLDGVLETGGDVTTFLEDETDRTLDRARSRQEAFLETLSTLQELYVGGLVVGPLFLILVLLIISLVGGDTLPTLGVVVYLGMPVATAIFLWYVRATAVDTTEFGRLKTITDSDSPRPGEPPTPEDDERLAAYRQYTRRERLKRRLREPLETARERPLLALVFSVPAALITLAAVAFVGVVEVSAAAMGTDPIRTTSLAVVLPALVATTPVAVLHELRARRALAIRRRFPEFLAGLSNANRSGLDVADALELVARRGTGPLAAELRLVANDVRWAVDVRRALETLRTRLGQRALGRTLRLIGDSVGASGDVHRVLDVASRDATVTERLDRDRREETATYTVVTTISFVVYLGIVVAIDRTFITEFAALAETIPEATPVGPIQFTRVPTETYRMLLFHAALIQAVANGLVTGQMADESLLSGLKYAIGFVVVTLAAFALLAPPVPTGVTP